ncbi:hippurate hydrolase [Aureobasidium sp. EXF-8845]|nr:hippurate hydrolase [Aureobasidium sp. EXF-8846]KAI4851112.1 hippurate hydrolase [Aureobasidium sp. EXF-8845]
MSKKSSPISEIVSSHRPDLDKDYIPLYKHFHAHPELSHQEKETAAKIAEHLSQTCPEVQLHTNIGGHGLAGILTNGSGPTVLLRADIDGLPVLEKTGLEWASTKRMVDLEGVEKPTMHACGHDIHITSLLAAASLLYNSRDTWSGTLIFCFQPAEEKGQGAQAMVDDGLYDKVPIPDVVLGGHVMPMRAGTLGTKRGLMASSADSLKVTLHGKGGHASQPHRLVDPVVMAASTVMRLQTIVSREVDPADNAVVTCACIIAGDAENVVADDAILKLDLRAVNAETRSKVLSSVKRIVTAESDASNAVKPPTFETTRNFPLTINDDEVTQRLEESFTEHFGTDENVYTSSAAKLGGSEDFGILATAIEKPSSFWTYGGTDPEIWDKVAAEGRRGDVPINHSAYFAPVIMPTLQVAVDAYAVAALTWLLKK